MLLKYAQFSENDYIYLNYVSTLPLCVMIQYFSVLEVFYIIEPFWKLSKSKTDGSLDVDLNTTDFPIMIHLSFRKFSLSRKGKRSQAIQEFISADSSNRE